MREALYYLPKDSGAVDCRLCPRHCVIHPGQAGFCRVRQNRGGALYAASFGMAASWGLDPIEKKPLYHFYPGAAILSFGATGCNLHCQFCQNWTIVHQDPETGSITPERAVSLALEAQTGDAGNIGIAYTYSEPLVWYEFVLETAILARSAGLKNVLVTNGYINEDPLLDLLPHIDAMNIDVKGFTDAFYRDYCAGRLAPALRAAEVAYTFGCHVELTNLLITGLNDSPAEIGRLVDWAASLSPGIPLHLSRYFPSYNLNLPPTPLATLDISADIASKKLKHVYIGNAPELGRQNTICPNCGNLLINRSGYQIQLTGLKENICAACGQQVNIRQG